MQYLNAIRPVHNGDNFSGTIRNLLPTYDGDVATFSGKAHVYEDNKGVVSRLFSYGIPVAEIAATPEGDKVVVLDYKRLISDNSPAKLRWSAVFKHIREFLHEHGISAEEPKDLEPFIVKEEPVPAPAPVKAESRIAHWVRNEHPRKPEEAWYTCSHCGKLALADGGNDILSDCCPHCGYVMKENDKPLRSRGRRQAGEWHRSSFISHKYRVEIKYENNGKGNHPAEFRSVDTKETLVPLCYAANDKGWERCRRISITGLSALAKKGKLFFAKPEVFAEPEEVESHA